MNQAVISILLGLIASCLGDTIQTSKNFPYAATCTYTSSIVFDSVVIDDVINVVVPTGILAASANSSLSQINWVNASLLVSPSEKSSDPICIWQALIIKETQRVAYQIRGSSDHYSYFCIASFPSLKVEVCSDTVTTSGFNWGIKMGSKAIFPYNWGPGSDYTFLTVEIDTEALTFTYMEVPVPQGAPQYGSPSTWNTIFAPPKASNGIFPDFPTSIDQATTGNIFGVDLSCAEKQDHCPVSNITFNIQKACQTEQYQILNRTVSSEIISPDSIEQDLFFVTSYSSGMSGIKQVICLLTLNSQAEVTQSAVYPVAESQGTWGYGVWPEDDLVATATTTANKNVVEARVFQMSNMQLLNSMQITVSPQIYSTAANNGPNTLFYVKPIGWYQFQIIYVSN